MPLRVEPVARVCASSSERLAVWTHQHAVPEAIARILRTSSSPAPSRQRIRAGHGASPGRGRCQRMRRRNTAGRARGRSGPTEYAARDSHATSRVRCLSSSSERRPSVSIDAVPHDFALAGLIDDDRHATAGHRLDGGHPEVYARPGRLGIVLTEAGRGPLDGSPGQQVLEQVARRVGVDLDRQPGCRGVDLIQVATLRRFAAADEVQSPSWQ